MRAEERGEKLTPAEFMLASSKGDNEVWYNGTVYRSRYASAASASRAFRKIRSGETSGKRMFDRGEDVAKLGPSGENTGLQRRRGLSQRGTWQVVVYMAWTDQNGNEHGRDYDDDGNPIYDINGLEKASFIVESTKHFNYFDVKDLAYDLDEGDVIDDYVSTWEASYGVSNVDVVAIDYILVSRHNQINPIWI
jgi:hypothetical protein